MDPRSDCIDFINPATGEKFGEVRMTTAEEVMLARREMAAAQITWAAKPLKERARIIKHVSGPFNAKGGDVAMEEMVLAFERLELE